jgi:hypothetical protein
VLLGVLFIGDVYARSGAAAAFLPCALLWTQLYTLGAINEGRGNAKRMEVLRLVGVVPLGFVALTLGGQIPAIAPLAWIAIGLYITVSTLWLQRK